MTKTDIERDFVEVGGAEGIKEGSFIVFKDEDLKSTPEYTPPNLGFITSIFQSVSSMWAPQNKLDSKKTTSSIVKKYIRQYAKDNIIIGCSIWFLFTNPIISSCIATAISVSALKLSNNFNANFWVGIGLYSAAVFSFFTNPLLTLGLGWGCSVASTITDVLTVTVLGINIPGAIYGPALLLSDLWVGAMGRAYVKKISEENFLGQMFKVAVKTGVDTLDQKLTNRGEQYFEVIGGNYTQGLKNLFSSVENGFMGNIVSKYYNKHRNSCVKKLEKEYVIVERQEDKTLDDLGFEEIILDITSRRRTNTNACDNSELVDGKYTQLVGGADRKGTSFVNIVRSADSASSIQK